MNWIKRLFTKKETTKQCDIQQGELLSCGYCKGTDLRKKGNYYYVCNYCGNTQTT